jgi:alkanesulfonate monooxygenase SsuD/methylene tetrahydromethanopterin reductase-like flavin-dependent oxidoreductase (luciferase family)
MAVAHDSLRVGIFPTTGSLGDTGDAAAYLGRVHDAGIDHVCCGDHVSFFVGAGLDGLLQATALATLHPTLPVMTGVYLLPLRHPVLVARQISDVDQLAPGRLIFGVGIGGEDRHEVEVCGVDPATRGRRMDECLEVLRGLLAGEPVSFEGEFIAVHEALVVPAPDPPIPLIVGGRSDAAVKRAARLGDGWLAVWVSPRRFASVVQEIGAQADAAGRDASAFEHGLNVWCGFGASRDQARSHLAAGMEDFYRIPFERFERYSPYGTPAEVADFLRPYVQAGCSAFNLIPRAQDAAAAIEGAGEVRRLLA